MGHRKKRKAQKVYLLKLYSEFLATMSRRVNRIQLYSPCTNDSLWSDRRAA